MFSAIVHLLNSRMLSLTDLSSLLTCLPRLTTCGPTLKTSSIPKLNCCSHLFHFQYYRLLSPAHTLLDQTSKAARSTQRSDQCATPLAVADTYLVGYLCSHTTSRKWVYLTVYLHVSHVKEKQVAYIQSLFRRHGAN